MREASDEDDRRETIEELTDLLAVAQQMGQRLANETHGDAYASVREFNELLHVARVRLTQIRDAHGVSR